MQGNFVMVMMISLSTSPRSFSEIKEGLDGLSASTGLTVHIQPYSHDVGIRIADELLCRNDKAVEIPIRRYPMPVIPAAVPFLFLDKLHDPVSILR